MKFAMIGAGAMGSIVGGYLQKGGAEVYLVDPFVPHIDAINAKGLEIERALQVENIKVKAVTSPDDIGEIMDVVIIFTKGYLTRQACMQSRCLIGKKTQVVTFQNGLGNPEILSDVFEKDNVLYGVIQFGGQLIQPGYVRALINNTSAIKLGCMKNIITPEMEEIQKAFVAGGFHMDLSEHADEIVWTKMLGNCQNNALCGITRLEMGFYFGCETAENLARAIDGEVRAVAQAKGIKLPPPPEKFGGHFQKTDPMFHHLTSTAQDIKRHKPTEIDFLNGAIVREGRQLGVPTPVNETITWICKVIEQNYLYQF